MPRAKRWAVWYRKRDWPIGHWNELSPSYLTRDEALRSMEEWTRANKELIESEFGYRYRVRPATRRR